MKYQLKFSTMGYYATCTKERKREKEREGEKERNNEAIM